MPLNSSYKQKRDANSSKALNRSEVKIDNEGIDER